MSGGEEVIGDPLRVEAVTEEGGSEVEDILGTLEVPEHATVFQPASKMPEPIKRPWERKVAAGWHTAFAPEP